MYDDYNLLSFDRGLAEEREDGGKEEEEEEEEEEHVQRGM